MANHDGGFFGEYGARIKKQVSKDHAELFSLSAEINHSCHELLSESKIDPENGKNLILSCLFIRSLELYQSAVILLQNGMANSSKIVLRGLLEVYFRMRNISEKDGAYQQYIRESIILKKETIEKTKEVYDIIGVNLKDDLEKIADDLGRKIKSNKWKRMSTYKVSEDAGMVIMYKTAYHMLSKTVHATSCDIENHLHFNEDAVLSGFGYSSTDEVGHLLLSAMDFCADTAILFGSASSPTQSCSEIIALKNKLNSLYPEESFEDQ